jgi:glycosyltransferase involved in cell wall biosynthesis
VDTEIFAPAQTDGNRKNAILLCSGLAVYRNRAAALWFARRMFPMVRREVPDAEFWIVGSHPNREIWRLAEGPGIHVTGTVEDVRPYYAMAKVAVAPYRYGEGTKIKVVEAMACGTPVVSTSIGCQGLDVIDGKHLLIADNETDFSRRVIELLRDQERAETLAAASRGLALEKYDWNRIISRLAPKLKELVGRPGGTTETGMHHATLQG